MIKIPYRRDITAYNGWTLSDEYIIHNIWDQLVIEGTVNQLFSAGGINNADEFIKYLQGPENFVLFIVDEDYDPLLLTWLNNAHDKRANVHFVTFKKTWGRSSIKIMKEAGRYWLSLTDENGNKVLHVLTGMIPEKNRLALRAVEKCNGKIIGLVPDYITLKNGTRSGVYFCYYYGGES